MDRIADVWGPRTPHAQGTMWPARADQHLEDGLAAGEVDRWVRSACLLCSNGCGCEIAVKDGRMVGVRGNPADVVNRGRLGPKGLYGSTPSLKESFGADGQPGCYADVEHCDALFLYGHNMAETQTVLWSRVLDRTHGADPPVLVCVDPRRTAVAAEAERLGGVHLAPVVGTNLALMNGLVRELFVHDWIDHDWVAEYTVGLDAAGRGGALRPRRGGPDLPGECPRSAARGADLRHLPERAVHRAAGLLPVASAADSPCPGRLRPAWAR